MELQHEWFKGVFISKALRTNHYFLVEEVIMKRIRWYKKGYKGLRLDTLLMGMLSIVIVLEINLGSGTLNMPDMVFVLLGVLSVGIFDAIIYVKGQRIRLEVRDSKRAIFSANAFRALKIVNIYGGNTITSSGLYDIIKRKSATIVLVADKCNGSYCCKMFFWMGQSCS